MSGDGAGEMDAGVGFAGEGLPQNVAGVGSFNALQALAFNGVDYEPNEAGDLAWLHPIDAKVRLALLTRKGGIPADPNLGFDWDTPFQYGERLTADVTNRIHDTLFRSRINVGTDIQEVRILVSSRIRGRVSFTYTYKNLRSGAEVTVNG